MKTFKAPLSRQHIIII